MTHLSISFLQKNIIIYHFMAQNMMQTAQTKSISYKTCLFLSLVL